MGPSLFIARLLGPMLVVVGIALLLRPHLFKDVMADFLRSAALIYLAGFFGLLGGLALVLTHNLWVADWWLIVTLIGWLAVLRAVVTIMRPEWIVAAGRAIVGREAFIRGSGGADLALGLVLSWFGYAG
ncbi:MAG TPA: hypothetical protein VJY39_13435 [Acidisphaera sp.]|nr:hypothetical protein [Acidisphaera sp.]